jgi:uncharacterized protein (DUF427 family)
MARERKEPGPDHPITTVADPSRVTVHIGNTVVAETTGALRMQEAAYKPVFYVPIDDVDRSLLRPSAAHTYCPYKGEASYWSLSTPDGDVRDAMWFYEAPYPAVDEIRNHVAFYPDRVQVTVESQDAAEVG